MTIYASSKIDLAPVWRALRASGININSSWIDYGAEGLPRDLAQRCVKEAAAADVLVIFCRPGDVLKGVLVEVGAALAAGREVRCVGDAESIPELWTTHAMWSKYEELSLALSDPPKGVPTIPSEDFGDYLEMASLALKHMHMTVADEMDLADSEVERLREQLHRVLNQPEPGGAT